MPGATSSPKGPGDVLVGSTRISYVGGEEGTLVYRGFDVRELVPGTPYESLVHLLLFGDPPSEDPSRRVCAALEEARRLPPALRAAVDALPPGRPPLEAMHTLLSMMGDGSYGYPPTLEQGYQLIARLPVIFTRYLRRSRGDTPIDPRPDRGHVANYLAMLHGSDPDPTRVRALEGYFDLLADHGMNPSTFALTIGISTHTDLISAATAALSVLKGPLHGGAPSRVVDMLDAIGTPDRAEEYVAEQLANRRLLYGFGHRVYKVEDPRAVLLHRLARDVADPVRLELVEAVERCALDALQRARPNARIYTNVEYYTAVLLEAVGIPPDCMTPTFGLARTVGWAAHAIEQAENNRMVRPDVHYEGPASGRTWPRPRGAS
ncbi:MAG: citrate/2-methylcitrate synthase [Thermoplasmata archaeon]|jgi:citrate synthase